MAKQTKTWADTSKRVTEMSRAAALKALIEEAGQASPRPYFMRRLYARWRLLQHREDQAVLNSGKVPEYVLQLSSRTKGK